MNWKKVKLEDIAEVIAGQSPPSEYYNQSENGMPFFQGKADFGEIFPTVRYWCTKPNKVSKPGDILYSVRAPVGPTNLNNVTACIGRGLSAIRPGHELDTKYLLHYLRYIEKEIADRGAGSTFKAITQKDLRAIQIPLPPLPTQRRLAAILDRADELRRRDRALLEKYEELGRSLFLEMFGDPVRNEKGWPVAKFGDVTNSRLGKMLDKKQRTGDHLRPYLRNANVLWNAFDLSDLFEMDFDSQDRKKFRLEYGDLLICEGGEVGRTAIWKNQLAECYYQKALHRVRPDLRRINAQYILYLMWFYSKYGGFDDYVSTATIAHLTGVKLKNMDIPLPPIDLQNQFAEMVENIELQKKSLSTQIERSEALFKSLLDRAFNGNFKMS